MTTHTGGGGGGGMGGMPPSQGKQQQTFQDTVKSASGKLGSGGGSSYRGDPRGTPVSKANPKDPYIYMGADSRIAFVPMSQAANMYYQWDAKTKDKFLSQLSLAGFNTGSLKDAELASLWAGYVEVAGKYTAAGKSISPWEVIGKDISQREAAVAAPRTVTQTSKQYNLSTAEDAQALFQGAAQTLLGRDPTKAEIARFKQTLNKYEQANPTITTTTSNYLGQDLQSQSSKTEGGVSQASQQLMAQEQAKKDPEYGAYQAATNGMNWLMEMIGGG